MTEQGRFPRAVGSCYQREFTGLKGQGNVVETGRTIRKPVVQTDDFNDSQGLTAPLKVLHSFVNGSV
jgi:hypothetical protein